VRSSDVVIKKVEDAAGFVVYEARMKRDRVKPARVGKGRSLEIALADLKRKLAAPAGEVC